ncbi:uncharacterized protein LOC142097313 [Mixophyes fleayi]|uniref:uncharacterized protein LOC142097313 n=1 Tax=Mixophyes fleayi TaxID=3061075 RepID=UPI003F4DFFE8
MERSRIYTGCLLLLLLHHSCSVLDVVAPPSHNAAIGSRTLLSCSFTVDKPPIQPSFLAILWYRGDKELLRYDNKGKHSSPRMSIDDQATKMGKASLSITNVTISDQGTYKCLVIYSPERQEKEIQLKAQAAPVVKIYKKALLKNEKNILLCSIMDFYPRDIKVTWLRNNQTVSGSVLGNFQMNADGTWNVNSSVTITPTQTQDNPVITCQVEHESLRDPIQDAFRVEYGVAPKVKLLSSHNGGEQIYVCEAQGFTPEAVEINWLLDGKRTEPPRRNADGRYNKCQLYRIDGKQQKRIENISCLVEHETLYNPIIETLTAESEENSRTTSLVMAVILTMLLTLCVTAVAWWFLIYKKKYFQRFQVSHIHRDQRWTDDEKVTLCCLASNCNKDVQVTWTVTEDGGLKVTVPDSETHSDGESGQLLSTYTVRTDQSQTDGLYSVITTLSFTPTVSKHKNMEVVCTFLCDGKSRERRMRLSFNSLKPQLSAPIELSLCDSGDVLCSVTLEKFYPRNIQINWSRGVGHYQELDTAKNNITCNSDYTCNAVSECRVPGHLYKDPGFRVRVTWSHQSLDVSEHREVSATDFPWHPVMDEIIKPPLLLHSTEAKLQCTISGYFPGDLDVKWMRREAGKQELYEVSPSDKYKIPVMEITQQSDKTYTCTASLIVSVSVRPEHGSEFVCRVTHPTLVTPLEKRTGELSVTGIPVIRNLLQDDGYIILEVDSFYPRELGVIWERADSEHGPYRRISDSDIENNSTVSSDGSYRVTSICDAMTLLNKMDPSDKYFKAIVEHEALKSPVQRIILRSTRIFYLIAERERQRLQQVDRRTVVKSISNHHHKSSERDEEEKSHKNPV